MHADSVADSFHSHKIQVHLRDIGQFFNTMDPSPFHEKDLDDDAEEFIVSWAREFPVRDSLSLEVDLIEWPQDQAPQPIVEQAVHNYFAYRARLNQMEFRRLMKEGFQSLLIGLLFLLICVTVGQILGRHDSGTLGNILHEGLLIGGWVAMWRPMEIYLYDWWPLRGRGKVYEKLSRIPVAVCQASGS